MTAILRYRKNLRSIEREQDAREMQNRILPQGAEVDGFHFTMADALWEVGAISGAVVTLLPDVLGPPIRFDDQLNGLFCRRWPGQAEWKVTGTSLAAQTVMLEDVPDTLVVGDFVQFRTGGVCLGTSGELVYLDRPASIATYGLVEGVLPRPDIPPFDNLVRNPYLRDWSANSFAVDEPDHWEPVGLGTLPIKVTGDENSRFGQTAASIFAVLAFETGIETEWIDVRPEIDRPFYSAQVVLLLQYGVVRFELEMDLVGDGSRTVIIPDPALPEAAQPGPGVRNNTVRTLRQWVQFGIAGINCFDDPAIGAVKRIKLRVQREIAASPDSAIYILDAGQLTHTPYNAETIYDFRGSNALWWSANNALDDGYVESRGMPRLRLTVNPLDLYREDPTAWAEEKIAEADDVKVQFPPWSVDEVMTVADVRRELGEDQALVSRFELSNRLRRLQTVLSSRLRPRTIIVPSPIEGAPATVTPGGGLSSLTASYDASLGANIIGWDLNDEIETAAPGRFTITISSTLGGVLVSGRDPTLEETGTDYAAKHGAYADPVSIGPATSTPYTVNVYTIELFDTGVAAGTYQVSRGDYYL
jgi:hypothetical protein